MSAKFYQKSEMIMIYYGGLGISYQYPEKIDLSKEKILDWEIRKLKGWVSPNLIIIFEKKKFEQPVGRIVNYKEVIKWLKKNATNLNMKNESSKQAQKQTLRKTDVSGSLPTEEQVLQTIFDCVFIRGIELEDYKRNFTNEQSGLYDALVKLFKGNDR